MQSSHRLDAKTVNTDLIGISILASMTEDVVMDETILGKYM
jgi:hypothetical protein